MEEAKVTIGHLQTCGSLNLLLKTSFGGQDALLALEISSILSLLHRWHQGMVCV